MRYRKYPGRSIHRTVIVGVALIYVALSVMNASCMLTHAQQVLNDHHHHSHDGSSPQNAFCAWACQATADTIAEGGPQLAVRDLVSGPAEFTSAGLPYSTYSSAIHSRAPPSVFFVRIG
jgi:hypothetical protein